MKLKARNDAFVCAYCNRTVEPTKHGTYRDHCPFCLYGLHVDEALPGDRLSECGGLLKPVGLSSNAKKGYIIHYRCKKCGVERVNKAAEDDGYDFIIKLSKPA